jgi:hypothetical protein
MRGARSLVWRRGDFTIEDERAWDGSRELPSASDGALFALSRLSRLSPSPLLPSFIPVLPSIAVR